MTVPYKMQLLLSNKLEQYNFKKFDGSSRATDYEMGFNDATIYLLKNINLTLKETLCRIYESPNQNHVVLKAVANQGLKDWKTFLTKE